MENYEVLTIGYEGWDIEEFVDRLKQFHISRLIDVREIPLSRKPGFSKTSLRERLEIIGTARDNEIIGTATIFY